MSKPYFDNIYKMGRSNARVDGQAWCCGRCDKPIYDGISNKTFCPHCADRFSDKEIALQEAQDRFGKWVKL